MEYIKMKKCLLVLGVLLMGVSACTVQKPLVKCGDESELIYPKAPSFFRASTASTPCAKRKVLIKLEMSNLGYIYRRDTTVMKAYQKMLFDSVALIFRNEPIPITLELVINKVWATADPYTAFTTGSTVLNAFAVTEFAKPEQSAYNLAVYVDRSNGANNKGSYGYRNGLNPGYYGQKYAYVCVPFGEPGTKDFRLAVKTMAHEIGHLFGLFHTSHCGNVRDNGTIGPLDSCASPEPISGQPVCKIPRKVITNGTIMSYCDVVSYLGGVDLKKGFGFKSMRTTMQQTLASCTTCPCDVAALEPQPCTYTYSAWSVCQPNGTQTRTVISQTPTGCTGTPVLSQNCTVANTLKLTISGKSYGTSADTARTRAIDGNTNTRWLASGTAIFDHQFSRDTTITIIGMESGWWTGSAWTDGNTSLQLTVDGVSKPLGFATSVDFIWRGSLRGKRFILTTTGKSNISRVREVYLK